MPLDLNSIAKARAAAAKVDGAIIAKESEVADARERRNQLLRSGATASAIATATRTIASLESERTELTAERLRHEELAERLRGAVATLGGFEASIKQLDPNAPVTMLPVRLETRFDQRRTELRVRIYPDTIHQDGHEPELTAEEDAAGRAYWKERWPDKGNEFDEAAWIALTRLYRPTRARWIAAATTPTNIDRLGSGEPEFADNARRPSPWTRAPHAKALPERWLLVGYRGDKEVLRRWGSPVADKLPMGPAPDLDFEDDPGADPPSKQDTLPIDDAMRWAVDYEVAVAKGMAITVKQSDLSSGSLAQGFDLLLAVGVDWTLELDEAAAALEGLVAAHSYADGLSVMPVGTATNVTGDAGADTHGDLTARPELLDPTRVKEPGANSSIRRLGDALGLEAGSALELAPGGSTDSDISARHMNNALWAPTWGYFLEQMMQPLIDLKGANAVHDHFSRYVRGRGPLPTLRVGRQPYGVLPVMSAHEWKPAGLVVEDALSRQLGALRSTWLHSSQDVPELGSGGNPDEVLVDLLRRTPRSEEFRFRTATGAALNANLFGIDLAAMFQEMIARTLLGFAGISGRPGIVDVTLEDTARQLPVPLAARQLSESAGLDPDYISKILQQLSKVGGFRAMVDDPETANSLLEALLRQAAQIEMSRASLLLIAEAEVASGVIESFTHMPREREIHLESLAEGGTARASGSTSGKSLMVENTPLELAMRPVAKVSGNRTVANVIAEQSNADLRRKVTTARFANFRTSLQHLAKLPSAELNRLAAETLDCTAHRLDAWITSLATRRLTNLRRDGSTGSHIGGFGWVEKLRPQSSTESLGYIHAPSLNHAATAAILRSGHLSRRRQSDSILAVDMSSKRVSVAIEILEGVRHGQPVGALLGYRFERGLRERSAPLAKYILEFRRAAPLDSATDGFDDGQPLEAIAARDVVDGVKLAERAKASMADLLNEVGVSTSDRGGVEAELRAVTDLLDAVSDVLVAEAVHQAVLGNSERSGAALDALDRQTTVPRVDVVRTPRTGHGFGHRVSIVLADAEPPSDWGDTNDPRAAAEPRLNAWVAAVLGDPEFIRFAAIARDEDGNELQPALEARLSELSLSPLATILAASGGGASESTELQERLAHHLFNQAPAGAVSLEFSPDPPDGSPRSVMGLAELMETAAAVTDLLGSCRPGDARDFVAGEERVAAGTDATEFKRRADAVVTAVRRAMRDLPDTTENPTAARLQRTLLAAADVGLRGAVPTSGEREDLVSQAAQVVADATGLLGRVEAIEDAFDRTAASNAEEVAHDLGRIRMIFGDNHPAAPLISVANGDEIAASLDARGDLLGAEGGMAPTSWLEQHGLVRPALARLNATLARAEARNLDVDATQLHVCQLPNRPGQRWAGMPLATGVPPPVGATSLVMHSPANLQVHEPFSAWIVDQWSETIPRTTETTGLSFHFDAPGARAPQNILVAVPPDPTAEGWTVDHLIGSVREAIDLSKMRAVDLDHLESFGRFLPASYLTFNLKKKTPSFDVWGLTDVAVEFANVEFLEGGGL